MTNKKLSEKGNSQNRALEMLESFGFSKNEAIIYMYLLERGTEIGGSKIAIGTKMHRQYVYLTLPRLTEYGLIEEIKSGHRSKYKAKNPSGLERIARRKTVEAEELVLELNKLSKLGYEQDFEIIVGAPDIRHYEMNRARDIKVGSTQYILGGTSKEYIATLGELYETEYSPLLKKKEILTKFIGVSKQKEFHRYLTEQRGYYEIRTLSKLKSDIVNFMVCNNNVYLYTFVNPPTLYVIKSKAVAESYLDLFNILWETAQK